MKSDAFPNFVEVKIACDPQREDQVRSGLEALAIRSVRQVDSSETVEKTGRLVLEFHVLEEEMPGLEAAMAGLGAQVSVSEGVPSIESRARDSLLYAAAMRFGGLTRERIEAPARHCLEEYWKIDSGDAARLVASLFDRCCKAGSLVPAPGGWVCSADVEPGRWALCEKIRQANMLLDAIKAKLPDLRSLLESSRSHRRGEDRFYRFYHQSFKVYDLQEDTEAIVAALKGLLPGRPLNSWFEQIIREGTGKAYERAHNERWLQETRPILEAFFHARTMLEMAVKYGEELDEAPRSLPSGWAALLYLYDLR